MFLASWPGGSWQDTLQIAGFILLVYAIAIWLTLIYWTYRDIRQRTRDSIMQAFSVLLVTCLFLPGHWVYLILRPRHTLAELYERSLEEEALLQDLDDQKACPTCRRRVKDEFLVCPSCRTQLKELCRSCSKPLSYAWFACPYCGLEKAPREGYGPPVRQGQRPPAVPRPTQTAPQPTQDVAATRIAAGAERFDRRPGPRAVPAFEEGPVIDTTIGD